LIQIASTPEAGAARKPWYRSLYVLVLAAIVAGGLIGHFWPEGQSLKPLGDAFIKLVKMIIAPVIFLTVSTGIAGMSDLERSGGWPARRSPTSSVLHPGADHRPDRRPIVVQPGAG
jgi:aerobic C4-dicarboxylate transport protein